MNFRSLGGLHLRHLLGTYKEELLKSLSLGGGSASSSTFEIFAKLIGATAASSPNTDLFVVSDTLVDCI